VTPGSASPRPTTPAIAAGLLGSAATIAAITVVARLAGFGRYFVFSGTVGTGGCVGNAYAAANLVPNVLFEVVAGGALAGAIVPVLVGSLTSGRREDADRIVSALLGWTILVLAPVAVVVAVAAGPLARLLVGAEACPGAVDLGARMLLVFAPQVVLYGVGVVLAGTLQAYRRFTWPALAPLLSSVVVIGAYVLYGHLAAGAQQNPQWLPGRAAELTLSVGTTLGVLVLSLPLLGPVLRGGTRISPVLRFPPGAGRRLRALALSGLGVLLAQQTAVVVALYVATRPGRLGALNVYQYAQAVYLLPYAVLAVPLATAAFPALAEHAERADDARFAAAAARSTRLVVLASCLGAALLVAVAPAVQALFLAIDALRGGPLGSLGASLVAYAPGLVGFGLLAHLSRALYARGRGRAAAVSGGAGWAVVVAGSLLLVAVLDGPLRVEPGRAAVLGLGIASSLGMTVAGAALLLALRRVAGRSALDGVARATVAAVVAAGLAAVAARPVVDTLLSGDGVGAAAATRAVGAGMASGALGLFVFCLAMAALDRRDVSAVWVVLRARVRGGGPA
jgi:putative peptidoglycan lipid II flippase